MAGKYSIQSLKRWAAAAAMGACAFAGSNTEARAQHGNPPGYCTYCENAHASDMAREDCDDEAGIAEFSRDKHEDYHRHRRDKRRHLYYKAQNAHYDLFYPICPPDWSATFGHHTTQWRPYPGACEWRYPVMSPGMSTVAPLYPVPAQGATPTAPEAPPAVPAMEEPYFPTPAPEAPAAEPPPPPRSENATEAVSQDTNIEILLMSSQPARPATLTRLPPPRLYTPATAFNDADASAGGWVPSIVR